jgi:predicted PurR-regulated permease PerM
MEDKATTPAAAPHRSAWIGILAALAVTLAVVLRLLLSFASVMLLALVAVGLLAPAHRELARVLGGERRVAAGVICVVLVVALLLPLFVIAREVSQEALNFYQLSVAQFTEENIREAIVEHQDLLDSANRVLRPLGLAVTREDVYTGLPALGTRLGRFLYEQGLSMAKGLVQFVISFLIWLIVVYFLLVDGTRLRQWLYQVLPLPAGEQDMLRRRFMDMASSLVVGNGVAAVIQAGIGGVLFALLGLPAPAVWGTVMWVLAFIPVIGISLVYIPAFFLLLLVGENAKAFAVLLPLMIVATVAEYWLKPALVGRRAQLHTLLVLLSLLGGLEAFGPVGILLGPLMMTAFLTLVSIYHEHYRPYIPTPRLRPGGHFFEDDE